MPVADFVHVDEETGLVFGWAMVSKLNRQPYYNENDTHLPEPEVLKASFKYMLGLRPALENHQGEVIGKIVFAFPLTEAVAKALGITSSRTGLIVGLLPDDPQMVRKFKSGELRGFSYHVAGMSTEVPE